MILDSLISVDRIVFQQFAGQDLKQKVCVSTLHNKQVEYSVVYHKMSAQNITEVNREEHPLITIVDQTPTLADDWHNDPENVRKVLGSYRSSDPLSNEEFDFASLFSDPLRFQFIYDVHVSTKDTLTHSAIQQWFFGRFNKRGAFKIDPVTIEGEEHFSGTLHYTMESTDIPRSDGVFESQFTFTVKAFVQLSEGEDIELVKTIIPTIYPVGL